ncbi:MAG: hypothetical protein DRP42_05605 [Tenericutes bacterium]|nr:MAG: hypothetical protein DRP42_05605 [Mycoplasmatota bacterium]
MLAILPAFISFFVPGMSGLAAFSALRALRVLTLLKGTRLGVGAMFLVNGFKNERKELAIVATMATFLVFIFALMIFQIEQEANPDISTFGDAL